jgi:hypothetical protein
MNNILITLDYEIFFGSNTGDQKQCVIYPTKKILNVLDKYGVKASFFVDSGYILKLNEYRKKHSILNNDYKELVAQIKKLSNEGHDIQLHIHSHWEDSYFDGTNWIIDTRRYRLHDFDKENIEDIVYRYKKVLTDIVGDKVFAYRAGGWCVQPFEKLKNALKNNNIWMDSTVFKGGKNNSDTHYFNFSNAPKKSIWHFENDPLIEKNDGYFTELPISNYKLSPLFFWKLVFYRKFGSKKYKSFGNGVATKGSKLDKLRMLTRFSNSVVSIDGYKASFLKKSYKQFSDKNDNSHFVIIGHPKALSEYSLEKLDDFLSKNIRDNRYCVYSDYLTGIK